MNYKNLHKIISVVFLLSLSCFALAADQDFKGTLNNVVVNRGTAVIGGGATITVTITGINSWTANRLMFTARITGAVGYGGVILDILGNMEEAAHYNLVESGRFSEGLLTVSAVTKGATSVTFTIADGHGNGGSVHWYIIGSDGIIVAVS